MRRRICARLFGEELDALWIGRFRVVEAVGYGGMGVVYCAEDDELGRQVAIKVIRGELVRDIGGRGPLLRQVRSLARLSHPNVVAVHEAGEHDDGVFIVMDLVRGTTLRAWLAAERRTLAQIVARFVAAGEGLAAAHRVGVVHGDFKPGNVLVGEDGRVRVTDFGLARRTAASEATTEAGTPGYVAPELRLGGHGDARSDQFCFCAALFEAVYGRAPDGVYGASLAAGPVPGWLRRPLRRGLAARPEDRHASMTALLAALVEGPRRRRALQYGVTGALAVALLWTVAVAAGVMAAKSARPRCDRLWMICAVALPGDGDRAEGGTPISEAPRV